MHVRLSPQALQLVSLLIAPVAALAGVWLSPFLTNRVEQRKWIRDQRMAAYASAIRAGQELLLMSTKETGLRSTLDWIKQELPDLKDSQASAIPVANLAPIIHELDDDMDRLYSPLFAALGDVALYGTPEAFAAYIELMASITSHDAKSIGEALGGFTGICRLEVGKPISQMRR
jgi:hypothetical protein